MTLQDHVDQLMGHPRTQPIQTMRDDKGKLRRRCESISPTHGLQCEKRRKHVKLEGKPVHMSGSVLWGSGTPTTKTLTEALQAAMKAERHTPPNVVSIDFKVPGGRDPIDLSSFIKDGSFRRLAGLRDPTFTFKGKFDSAQGTEPSFTVYDEAHRFTEDMAPAAETPSVPILPLDDWWFATAEDEIARTVPKVEEYGATDLRDTGQILARTMGREVGEEEAIELGIFFYLVGKMSRWQSAVERGDRPGGDTLFDIGVYVRMAQRARYAGTFPGPTSKPEDEEEETSPESEWPSARTLLSDGFPNDFSPFYPGRGA